MNICLTVETMKYADVPVVSSTPQSLDHTWCVAYFSENQKDYFLMCHMYSYISILWERKENERLSDIFPYAKAMLRKCYVFDNKIVPKLKMFLESDQDDGKVFSFSPSKDVTDTLKAEIGRIKEKGVDFFIKRDIFGDVEGKQMVSSLNAGWMHDRENTIRWFEEFLVKGNRGELQEEEKKNGEKSFENYSLEDFRAELPMENEKLTKDNLKWYTSGDNFYILRNGKEYNIGQFLDGYAMIDEDDNETRFKDFEDIWENCQIDGVYLRDMLDDLECYEG